MFGAGLGGAGSGGRDSRERRENAQLTRAQLRIAWADKRERLRQWYLRLTGNKPMP